MFVLEARASTVLFNYLKANPTKGKYLLPANICPIVPLTFLKAKTDFELVDISLTDYRIDESALLSILRTKNDTYAGVFYAHPYGEIEIPANFFRAIKNINNEICIIDDRCLCPPLFEEPSSNDIDLILWSSGYGKIVDLGSGGLGWVCEHRNYLSLQLPFFPDDLASLEKQYKHAIEYKKRIIYHDSNWLETQLYWDKETFSSEVKKGLINTLQERSLINEIYENNIPKRCQFPKQFQTWRFNIRIPNKTTLIKNLFNNNMFASSHYAALGPVFSVNGYYPNAETVAEFVVNLFNDHHYNIEMAYNTCEIINKHLMLEESST